MTMTFANSSIAPVKLALIPVATAKKRTDQTERPSWRPPPTLAVGKATERPGEPSEDSMPSRAFDGFFSFFFFLVCVEAFHTQK